MNSKMMTMKVILYLMSLRCCNLHPLMKLVNIQSGASSLAKHGGAYFAAVCGSVQDPIAAPGLYENQEP